MDHHSSLECEHLIRRMLVINPAKRLVLSKVLVHKWMTMETKKSGGEDTTGTSEPAQQKLQVRVYWYT